MEKVSMITRVLYSQARLWMLKLLHIHHAQIQFNKRIRFGARTRITLRKQSKLKIRGKLVTRNNVELIVGENAEIIIGNHVFVNSNCIFSARKSIIIGDRVLFGPHCLVYDNDHDYHVKLEERGQKFQLSDVRIGNDVWIGAGTIILKGTQIGNNCVIAAGSIVKGRIPDNSRLIQKRDDKLEMI